MSIDLEDFRQWKASNTTWSGAPYPGRSDPRAFSFGFAFLHENFHNRGVGMVGVTKSTFGAWDKESAVINQVNIMQIQMGLPARMGHKRLFDSNGGYIPFSNGQKFYLK